MNLEKKLDKIVEKLDKLEVSKNNETDKEEVSVAQNENVEDIIRGSDTRKITLSKLEGTESIQVDGEPVDNKWLKCHRILGAPIAFSSPRARYKSSHLCLFTSISRERF